MIALVDYDLGNLRSVEKALETIGADVQLTSDPEVILAAEKVVLPGVGAFGDGMVGLRRYGLIEVVQEVVGRGTPLLGICVGMQVLFEEGEEHGRHQGLGLLPGRVRHFETAELKVPQTGWNQILPARETMLLDGLLPGDYAYFNHGYYCDAAPDDTLAQTEYGVRYASVVGRGRLYGVQFHPEKSQRVGMTILRNFVERG
ncbi:MAG: imidazole glycerol phosphate synthase subunit HisH [Roseiflexaceae bacterium]